MRVYFNLVRRQEVIEDDDGVDIADLGSARTEVVDALIEMKRSIRFNPSQWMTSGINCWKRASCTPATHSVRSK